MVIYTYENDFYSYTYTYKNNFRQEKVLGYELLENQSVVLFVDSDLDRVCRYRSTSLEDYYIYRVLKGT